MPLSTKILIGAGTIVLISALAFIIFKQVENSNRQLAIESQIVQQKQLIDGVVRSQITWTTQNDLNKYLKDNGLNLKTIQDDLSKLHAEITSANTVVVNSSGQIANNLPSTNTGPNNPNNITYVCKDGSTCPNTDPFGYVAKQQNLDLNEDFGTVKIPIGSVGFSAWQPAPWNIYLKPREYHVSSVVGTDENQRMYFYNKFVLRIDNKDYVIPIKTANTEQIYPIAKFSWFNPRLYLAANGLIGLSPIKGEFTPSLNIQIASYGRYLKQPDFSILQIGVGYGVISQRPQIVVSPVSYNIGKNIPLMNNTYIGPVLSVGTDGNVFFGAGISVGL